MLKMNVSREFLAKMIICATTEKEADLIINLIINGIDEIEQNSPVFKTIRQTAAMGLLNENQLRGLVSKGECPGMQVGNRFMVNITALSRQLAKESVIV